MLDFGLEASVSLSLSLSLSLLSDLSAAAILVFLTPAAAGVLLTPFLDPVTEFYEFELDCFTTYHRAGSNLETPIKG